MADPAAIGPMYVSDTGVAPASAVVNPSRPAAQTNRITTLSNIPNDLSYSQVQAVVLIETAFESGVWASGGVIDWSSIVEPLDGLDFVANLRVATLDFQSGEHFAEHLQRLTPDRRIRIGAQVKGSAATVLFQGFVRANSISWNDRGQGVSAVVLSEAQEYTRHGRGAETSIVHGRMMRSDPVGDWDDARVGDLIEHVTSLQAVFNAGGKGNRTLSEVHVLDDAGDQHRMHFFETDDSVVADRWTYSDALRYLVFFYLAQKPLAPNLDTKAFFVDVVSSSIDETAPDLLSYLLAQTVKPDLSIESMSVDEALKTIVAAAGLHYHWVTYAQAASATPQGIQVSHYLRILATRSSISDPRAIRRQMGRSRLRSVPRRAAFFNTTTLSARRMIYGARAIGAQLTADTSRQINRPVYLGGYIEHEVTILLRPGWLPHDNLDNVVVPNENEGLLTGDDYEDAIKAAQEYWAVTQFREFRPGGDHDDRTKYHGQHQDFADVSDVMRLWIFPDDDSYVQQGGAVSDFARNGTGIPAWPGWTKPRYSPFFDEDAPGLGLAYQDSKWGGSLDFERVKDWVPRPRPFQDTQGRFDLTTKDRAPIVHISFGHEAGGTDLSPFEVPGLNSSSWMRFAGGVEILTDRAGIRFVDDNIWNSPGFLLDPSRPFASFANAFTRYLSGLFWVRITACVRSDQRMRYAPTSFVFGGSLSSQRSRHAVKDMGYDRFKVRATDDGNSWFRSRFDSTGAPFVETDPNFLERDDTNDFRAFADRDGASALSVGVAGYWTQPWLDMANVGTRIGDTFVGVPGLGIMWDSFPALVSKVHMKTVNGHQSTKFVLQDRRHNPELG